jgi:hypothetical protein
MKLDDAMIRFLSAMLVVASVAGCSNAPLPSLTTGSLFGSKPDAQAAAVPAAARVIRNDPTARALYVSRVAAKAQRCGFNVSADKLKSTFLAAEGAQPGSDVAELAKLDKIYGVTFNGTTKAAMADEAYCSPARTAHVKADLARHLSGDFTPGEPLKEVEEDDGLFSGSGGLFDGAAGTYKAPTFSTNNL